MRWPQNPEFFDLVPCLKRLVILSGAQIGNSELDKQGGQQVQPPSQRQCDQWAGIDNRALGLHQSNSSASSSPRKSTTGTPERLAASKNSTRPMPHRRPALPRKCGLVQRALRRAGSALRPKSWPAARRLRVARQPAVQWSVSSSFQTSQTRVNASTARPSAPEK